MRLRALTTIPFTLLLACGGALEEELHEAEETLSIAGCGAGWQGGQVTFTPNISSFTRYSNALGLGWTEAQIRQELVAAAEEINLASEAALRVSVADSSTNLLAVNKNDTVHSITLCDPANTNVNGCKPSIPHSGGGLANLGCANDRIVACDIQLFHRGAYSDPIAVARWRLQHELGGSASRSVYRTMVHEMLHCLGLDHYAGPWPSVMNAGGSDWGNDFNKLYIQHYDALELQRIYGVRRHTIRYAYAFDNVAELAWTDSDRTYGTTAGAIGALQTGREGDVDALFARVGDGSRPEDEGANSLTVYRKDAAGQWGYTTVASVARNNMMVRGAPAFAKTDREYVVAFADHNRNIRVARTVRNNLDVWRILESGFVTNTELGLAYLSHVDRLYMVYANDANSARATELFFTASSDDGASFGPLYTAGFSVFGGASLACLDDAASAWPCTLSYLRFSDRRAVWRAARPRAGDANVLEFGAEQLVGVDNDFSTTSPTVSAGPSVRGARALLAYDRNGDQPLPDYAARALTASGAYDARSFAVDGWRNRWIGASFASSSRPAMSHMPSFDKIFLFFTRYE